MSETANKLLNLSHDDQKRWVESQDWFKQPNFIQSLYDAEVTALAVPGLEEDLNDHLINYEDYGCAGMLKTRGFISSDRADELEDSGNFTDLEKDKLRECLVLDALDDFDVIEARSLKVCVNETEVLVTFYGSNHPNFDFCANFLGVFSNERSVEEAMSGVGVVIDNFLSGVIGND